MPGLSGCINAPDPALAAERMTAAMHFGGWLTAAPPFSDARVAAGRTSTGTVGPTRAPVTAGGVHLWVEGEFYAPAAAAADAGPFDEAVARAMIAAYRAGNLEAFLHRLDGYFCAALYDPGAGRVILITDRYGMRPLYLSAQGRRVAWASAVRGLLALDWVESRVDTDAVRTFLDIGHFLADRTWFEGVRLLPPASTITIDVESGAREQAYYWKWSAIRPSGLAFDDAVDATVEAMRTAVARRFQPDGRTGMTLSGGYDSRMIFAAANEIAPEYIGYAYTFGPDTADDVRIARRVAARSPWRHEVFRLDPDRWLDQRHEQVWLTDGMKNLMHMHGSDHVNEVHRHMAINLNGYLGGTVSAASHLAKAGVRNQRITPAIARRYYGEHVRDEWVEDDFYDIDHIEPFLFMNRGRRHINMGTVNVLHALDQRKPYFDNDYVELMMSLPDEYRINRRLFGAAVMRAFPRFFRDIPWQETGRTLRWPNWTAPFFALTVKATRVPARFGIGPDWRNYADYRRWIRRPVVARRLAELLDPTCARYRQHFADDFRARWLDPHLAHRHIDHSERILRCATVEIYLRQLEKVR